MKSIRVLLADDHGVLRDSLRAFLSLHADLDVVGEAADGLETLRRVQELQPDVLLLDMAMPNLGGLEVLRRVGKENPTCNVLVLTQHELPEYILPALKAGAKGYLLKRAGGSEVVQAIRAVARGDSYLHPAVANFVIEAAIRTDNNSSGSLSEVALTDRENEVLSLIGEGKTNTEVARALSISTKTVDKHRANLMEKLGIDTRAGLIRYAIEKKS